MISGKLRSKAARGVDQGESITIDGTQYFWHVRHDWLVWGKGIKVVSISVSLRPDRTRELILDLTMKMGPQDPKPSPERLLTAIEPAIRKAMEAGWDPESRGRAFRFEVAGEI